MFEFVFFDRHGRAISLSGVGSGRSRWIASNRRIAPDRPRESRYAVAARVAAATAAAIAAYVYLIERYAYVAAAAARVCLARLCTINQY